MTEAPQPGAPACRVCGRQVTRDVCDRCGAPRPADDVSSPSVPTQEVGPVTKPATRREGTKPATRREGGKPATRRGGGKPSTRREEPDDPRIPADLRRRSMLPAPLEGRFEYLADLPFGAQADVRLCRDRATQALVVIKVYRFDTSRLDHEALAAIGRAHNDHVVETLERGEYEGNPWEIQEYCEHRSLVELRARHGGTLPEDVFRAAVGELCEALAHLHEHSVVHRDIKPENVLVRATEPLDLVLADGRLALAASTNLYDIIVSDALPPQDAYSGLLFSVEYFQLCLSRLAPGGIICCWTPTPMVRASFRKVFPDCLAFHSPGRENEPPVVLVGGRDPLPVEPAVWLARLDTPRMADYFAAGILDDLRPALASGHALSGTVEGEVITDLFPRNEFQLPRR